MNCPKCKGLIPDSGSEQLNYCPFCGVKLFEEETEYLVEVLYYGHRRSESGMLLFVDDSILYELKPGESIYFPIKAGYHSLKFRYDIRNKSIHLLVSSNYSIKASYNSLSSLIETAVTALDEDSTMSIIKNSVKAEPVLDSGKGGKTSFALLGEDEPEFEIKVSTGLKEGILRIYTDRMEFSPENELKKDITSYKDVDSVSKKLGSIDIRCDGNVHKIYSIPKDIYNEVMAFLTNRIQ